MDTKARAAVLAGGLVLVGMVAWVLMPSGDSTPEQSQDLSSDTGDLALVPFDSSTAPQVDPFAAPTTAPSVPAVTSLDGALPAPGVMDVVPASTGTTTSSLPAIGTPALTSTVNVGPAVPETTSDTWGRAFEQKTSATVSTPGASFTTASAFDTSSAMTSLSAPAGFGASEPVAAKSDTYTVASGDSLYTISQKLYGTPKHVSAILAANPGLNPKRLKLGQTLKLPDVTGTSSATSVTSTSSSVSSSTSLLSTSSSKTYKVQSGDTLHKIAKTTYGQTGAWEKIYAANKSAIGSNPARLKVGMVLQLP